MKEETKWIEDFKRKWQDIRLLEGACEQISNLIEQEEFNKAKELIKLEGLNKIVKIR